MICTNTFLTINEECIFVQIIFVLHSNYKTEFKIDANLGFLGYRKPASVEQLDCIHSTKSRSSSRTISERHSLIKTYIIALTEIGHWGRQ